MFHIYSIFPMFVYMEHTYINISFVFIFGTYQHAFVYWFYMNILYFMCLHYVLFHYIIVYILIFVFFCKCILLSYYMLNLSFVSLMLLYHIVYVHIYIYIYTSVFCFTILFDIVFYCIVYTYFIVFCMFRILSYAIFFSNMCLLYQLFIWFLVCKGGKTSKIMYSI